MWQFDAIDKELLIKEIANTLAEDWYAAEDWGEDPFTSIMTSDEFYQNEEFGNKVFEASCYYVVQHLMYSEFGVEILRKVTKARDMRLIEGRREDC